MMMSSLSVKARLFLTTGLLTVGMLVVGFIGLHALKQADGRLDEVYNNRFVSALSVNQMVNLRNENVRYYSPLRPRWPKPAVTTARGRSSNSPG